jgi:hypothetical protein
MENFNKYLFIENLTAEITAEIEKGIITTRDGIERHLLEEISNATVYSSECFAICMSLGATEFETAFGVSRNIYGLAYDVLLEFVYSEIDLHELTELL